MSHFAKLAKTTVQIGPLRLIVEADPLRGQALVTVVLVQTTVHTQLLTLIKPRLKVDAAYGDVSASGTIRLRLKTAPQLSIVKADVVAVDSKQSYPFKGELESWVAQSQPVVADYVLTITKELSTLTTVRGELANLVDFSFVVHDKPVASMTATQFAPNQKWPSKIEVGSVVIYPDAKINLKIPTTLASGFLFLTAKFSTLTTPPTPISSSVANWQLPSKLL